MSVALHRCHLHDQPLAERREGFFEAADLGRVTGIEHPAHFALRAVQGARQRRVGYLLRSHRRMERRLGADHRSGRDHGPTPGGRSGWNVLAPRHAAGNRLCETIGGFGQSFGAVGAIVCTAAIRLLEQLKIDDVVGAVPAHLFAGAWGTIATVIAAGADIGVQLLGLVSVGAFAFTTSWLTWLALEKTIGVRVSLTVEQMGQDVAELGIDAYPEFVLMPERE